MKLQSPHADIFVPRGNLSAADALARTTHLCIGAHPDDIEAMAYHGIADCFGRDDRWFSGVTVTNGSGSARTGFYAKYSDDQMIEVRRSEQRKAAIIGDYSIQIQLGHESAAVKTKQSPVLEFDLRMILEQARPEVVFLHQPADKHDTHVAVFAHSLRALRALPTSKRPRRVFGCEGWRDLDWLMDDEKHALDTGKFPGIAASLMGVFDSQNTGGKRFDLAIPARRCANATFHDPHVVDQCSGITWAMDLTPLIANPAISPVDFIAGHVDRFKSDVLARAGRFC